MVNKEQQQQVIIGVGLPRTGTNSLKLALEILLDGPCYHMKEYFLHKERDYDFWIQVLNHGDMDKESWNRFFRDRNLKAGVDYPITLFYKDLLEAFPNAKFILTTRSVPDWMKSVQNSIVYGLDVRSSFPTSVYLAWNGQTRFRNVPINSVKYVPNGFSTNLYDATKIEEQAQRFYDQWYTEVVSTIDSKRLLIFSIQDGWTPLCRFLNVMEPDLPFPRVNDVKSMRNQVEKLQKWAWFCVVLCPLSISVMILSWIYY